MKRKQIEPGGFKVAEAAAYCGVHPLTIRKAIASGRIRSSKGLRTRIIPREDLDRVIRGEIEL